MIVSVRVYDSEELEALKIKFNVYDIEADRQKYYAADEAPALLKELVMLALTDPVALSCLAYYTVAPFDGDKMHLVYEPVTVEAFVRVLQESVG